MTRAINLDNYNSFSGADVVVTAQMNPINGKNCKTHILSSLQTISYSTHQDRAPVRAIGNINALDYVQGQRTIAGTMVFAMFNEHWMSPLLEELSAFTSNTDIWSDELPALNLTISVSNEYGYKSNMAIYGVVFIDDGGVMSINDLYTENTLQFIAVGIEPLSSQGQFKHTFSNYRDGYTIVSADTSNKWKGATYESYKKEWTTTPYTPNPGVTKQDPTSGTTNQDPTPGSNAEVIINKPIVDQGNGVVNILLPEKDHTNIYITSTNTSESITVHKKPGINEYFAELGIGDYSIKYEDPDTGIYSDPYLFSMGYDNETVTQELFPIVSYVSNDSISIIPNSDHNKLMITKESEFPGDTVIDSPSTTPSPSPSPSPTPELEYIELNIELNNNKEMVIGDLLPNTIYSIYTFDKSASSNKIYVKTFSNKEELFDIFKNYVLTNSNLHTNKNIIDFDFDSLEIGDSNIIDSVLKIENDAIRNELLIYAEKLQNEITRSYNEFSIYSAVRNDYTEPLKAKFDMSEDVKSLIIYMKNKNKNYYVSKVQANNDYEFIGKSNIRYYTQPILNNNSKGCYNHFIYYNTDVRNELKEYENVNNLKKLFIVNYKNEYDKYNKIFLEAIKAYDNFYLYRDLLEPPYCEFNNKVLIANVNYKEKLQNNNKDYYLCIGEYKDVLDHTPIRKNKINGSYESINLTEYYSGILENSYYLIWIEDDGFNSISKPFILSTYETDEDIISFYNNLAKEQLKDIKYIFDSNHAVFKSLYNNLYLEMLSENISNLKDFKYTICSSLITMESEYSNTAYTDDLAISILSLMSTDYKNRCGGVTKHNNLLTFNNVILSHMASVHIAEDGSIVKKSYEEYTYDLDEYNDGYTVLFLVEDLGLKESGFILINNISKETYSCNITLEVK